MILENIDRSIYVSEEAAQGEYGERLVNKFFKEGGWEVFTNINPHAEIDTAIMKDGITESLQIKSCTRFVTKNSFRFPVGVTGISYQAMLNADHLICVIRHPDGINDPWAGKIVKILNHKSLEVARDRTIWVPTNDKTTEIIGEISEQELRHLCSFRTGKR